MTSREATISILLVSVAMVCLGCGPRRSKPVVVTANSRVETAFRNELSASFVLESIDFRIDDRVVVRHEAREGEVLEAEMSFPALTLSAEEHVAKIHVTFRGEGYGIFSYLKEYKFDLKSSHKFDAPPLKTISITATCFEQGGPTTELSERPSIRWIEKIY